MAEKTPREAQAEIARQAELDAEKRRQEAAAVEQERKREIELRTERQMAAQREATLESAEGIEEFRSRDHTFSVKLNGLQATALRSTARAAGYPDVPTYIVSVLLAGVVGPAGVSVEDVAWD